MVLPDNRSGMGDVPDIVNIISYQSRPPDNQWFGLPNKDNQ
jgi:hypothetical protein